MVFPISPDGKWKKLTCAWLRHKPESATLLFGARRNGVLTMEEMASWRLSGLVVLGRSSADGVLGASWSGRVRIPDP